MKHALLFVAFAVVCRPSYIDLPSGSMGRLVENREDCRAGGHVRSIEITSRVIEEDSRQQVTTKCLFNPKGGSVEVWRYLRSASQRTVNVLDAKGRVVERDLYDADKDPQHPIRSLMKYDEQGREIESSHLDAEGKVILRDTTEYDSLGNAVKTTHYGSDGNASGSETNDYKYDGGRKLQEESSGPAKHRIRYLYQYDAQGQIASIETTVAGPLSPLQEQGYGQCGDCGFVSPGKSTYKYNIRGLLSEEQIIQPSGLIVRLNRYRYDNRGNLIQRWSYLGVGYKEPAKKIILDVDGQQRSFNATNGLPETTYSFDMHGNWIKAVETRVTNNDPTGKREIYAVTYRTIRYY